MGPEPSAANHADEEHIGFYLTPSSIEVFKEELSGYRNARGFVQLPIDELVSFALIHRIVEFRVNEALERIAAKR